MKSFCLPPKDVEKFKLALKSKEINIGELINMDTATRTNLLRNYAGDMAPEVNLLFEQKLVLKNRVQGIKNWASKVGEIGRYSPNKKAQIEKLASEYRDKQFERTFSPKENESFLNDLVDTKLGTHVTIDEAKQIFDLYKTAENFKKNYSPEKGIGTNHEGWSSEKEKLDYGLAQVASEKYIENLKNEELSIVELAQRRLSEFKGDWKEYPAKAVGKLAKDAIVELDKNSIAVVASIDDSFIGRQGLKTLETHPTVWAEAAAKSFSDIYKSLKEKHGNEKAKDILHADMVSRPNYINGNYQKSGIIASFEEQYPTSHPARIPYIGRAFKASEVAFTNSALRMRMNTFDMLLDMAQKNGATIDDVLVKDIGSVVNSATARAEIGRGNVLSLVLWAPRMMMSNINVLTAHGAGIGLKTGFARKQAAINLMKIAATTGTVAALLNSINPGSVETDARSTDFLKYKDGNTRIDLTGGSGQYITLLARELSGQSKNAQTKIIKDLGEDKYGASTRFSVGIDFLTNKTTPLVRTGIYLAKGRNFQGQKPTIASTISDLAVPIPVQNFYQNFAGDYPEGDTIAVVGSILDLFGVNANTYQNLQDWNNTKSKKLENLKKRVGEERFNQMNIKYNNMVNKLIDYTVKTPRYQKLSDEEKQKVIQDIKRQTKRRYGL
jgi:hypothetical protein